MIDRAYAAGDMLVPENIRVDLIAARRLLWIAWGAEQKILAVLVTQLVRARSGLVCQLLACAGADARRWTRFRRDIENYARAEGCVAVALEGGRSGWLRVLPDYRPVRLTLEKRL